MLSIAGILLFFTLDLRYRTGILLGVVSTLLASLYTIASRFLGRRFSTETILYEEMCGGFLALTLLLPFYLLLFPAARLVPTLPETGELLLFALFCTVGLYWCQIRALKTISAFTVNLSYNLEPVYSILLAMLIFREHRELSAAFYGCLSLLVLSVLLQSIRQFRNQAGGEESPAGS